MELIAARKRSRARSTSTATKHGVLLDHAADFAADKEEPQEQEERGVTAAPQEAAAADAAAKAQKEKAKEEARRFRARATAGLQHLELREEVGGSTAQKSGSATVDVDAAVAELEGLSYMKLKNELVREGVYLRTRWPLLRTLTATLAMSPCVDVCRCESWCLRGSLCRTHTHTHTRARARTDITGP